MLRHDLHAVRTGGRVLDPETGLDAIRNVGVKDGRIGANVGKDKESMVTDDYTLESSNFSEKIEKVTITLQ